MTQHLILYRGALNELYEPKIDLSYDLWAS